MHKPFDRLEMMIGEDKLAKLNNYKIAIFGLGGVGGYVAEALVRSNISELHIIDNDKVDITNFNRQIIALNSTLNEYKVDAFEKRLLDINPNIKIYKYPLFYLPEHSDEIPFASFDYIVDAIDTVSAKIDIIKKANDYNIPIISAMGCGNRMDPTKLKITDIYKTKNDPLAKIMRHELKKLSIPKLTVVYSEELPNKPLSDSIEDNKKRHIPASSIFVPACAGLYIASYIIRELIKD